MRTKKEQKEPKREIVLQDSAQRALTYVIDNGDAFYAHEFSAHFNPLQLVLDFKSVTPRIDVRSKESPVLNIKHNVILTDPYHAKQLLALLAKSVERYEIEFGPIEKPNALVNAETKMKKQKKPSEVAIQAPSYLG